MPDWFGHSHPTFSQATLACRINPFSNDFQMPAPTHIKIDADRGEALILCGAPEKLHLTATAHRRLVETSRSLPLSSWRPQGRYSRLLLISAPPGVDAGPAPAMTG